MKNKLIDLNNHLFAQMERLGNEGLKGDELKAELERAKSMTGVANSIISNADLALKAQMAFSEGLIKSQPAMIGADNDKA